ncbi:hypothetical protein B0T21DRAFT_383985 [Apiosordaria backusii]|uniref:Rhodopsin domain-containing protein n=1 Tax=Apiosordaria backusii TaxID=314023 RepID=A0AA40EE08_9PEZI|nr:hypothetical protein B0T21DRAFT_383985 [Apiosordaria backusii]
MMVIIDLAHRCGISRLISRRTLHFSLSSFQQPELPISLPSLRQAPGSPVLSFLPRLSQRHWEKQPNQPRGRHWLSYKMVWVDNATPEVDAISQWRTIVIICTVLSFFSVLIVSARLWIRDKNHGLAADDWMAAISMFFGLLYSILCIVQTKYGLGLPIALRPKANLLPYSRSNFAGRPIYQMGISFFKVALLISYLRLFKGTNHLWYRRVVWIAMFFVVAGHLGCALTLIFACNPVHKSWDPTVDGKCLAPGPSFTAYAIVTIVSDVAVAIIPIPVLLQLKVSRGKKAGLIVIFLLGLFTTLCSVFRYMQIDNIQNGDGNSTMLIVWGVIEFNVGNMVSSLPFLAPIFLRKAKEYTTKYSGGSGNGYHSGGGSNSRKLGGKSGGESYKLSSVSSGLGRKGTFISSKGHPGHSMGSEENILKDSPDGSIMKSVTYSVHVDESERRTRHGERD